MKQPQWLIWSNEHRAYWGPQHMGYTKSIKEAGRYTEAQAITICSTFRSLNDDEVPPSETMIREDCLAPHETRKV